VCAASINKKIWLPNLPSFMVKLLFGEMSMLLLEGVQASHEKLTKAGFTFKHTDLKEAISSLLVD